MLRNFQMLLDALQYPVNKDGSIDWTSSTSRRESRGI